MFDLKGTFQEVEEAKAVFSLVRTAIEEWSLANCVKSADLNADVDILWATMHGMVALTMTRHIYGGPDRAKNTPRTSST